jgi:hypothetical protein
MPQIRKKTALAGHLNGGIYLSSSAGHFPINSFLPLLFRLHWHQSSCAGSKCIDSGPGFRRLRLARAEVDLFLSNLIVHENSEVQLGTKVKESPTASQNFGPLSTVLRHRESIGKEREHWSGR